MNEKYIQFTDVKYRYPRTKNYVLKDINLKIRKGEFVVLTGENGSGKTTLCKCCNGIIPHSQRGRFTGRILIDGLDTRQFPTSRLAQKVGIVLEDPDTQLFTTKVQNEVAFGPENLGIDPAEILKRVEWALSVVRLTGYEDRSPASLSGGEKQRLAFAAALAMEPDIMVLDEPTSQLDSLGTEEVFQIVQELKQNHGMTIIMASHKIGEILQYADRVCVLHKGEVAAYDTPEVVFRNKDLFDLVRIKVPYTYALSNYLEEKGGIYMEDCRTVEEGTMAVKKIVEGARVHV